MKEIYELCESCEVPRLSVNVGVTLHFLSLKSNLSLDGRLLQMIWRVVSGCWHAVDAMETQIDTQIEDQACCMGGVGLLTLQGTYIGLC